MGGKQIAAGLTEIVAPKHSALLIWDMKHAIGPNAFNYKDILAKLKSLSARAREAGVPVFYSVQTGFDLMKEEAPVWVRVRMKRAKVKCLCFRRDLDSIVVSLPRAPLRS